MLKSVFGMASAVIVALATGVVGAALGYMSSNREMDVKMVEIAVGILSQEPKENIAPAREWAVDVISHYAEVKPSNAVRSALIENRAVLYTYGGYEPTYGYGDYYDRPKRSSPPPPAN
jgi:hypothetical protein